jgi:hypothetical protein
MKTGRTIKKIITMGIITAGATASLIAGIAIGAHAQSTFATFFGTDHVAQASRQFVVGYAEGVSDTMTALGDAITNPDGLADPQGYIVGVARCFTTDGRTAWQLADWAIRKWQIAQAADSRGYNAASVMVAEACNP